MTTVNLSFLGDPQLKKDMVSEMELHQEQDAFMKGVYGKENGQFKGCAVGCSIHSLNMKRGLSIAFNDHKALAGASGIPEWLYWLQDILFENLPEGKSKQFPVDFFKAMPVGVNLEPVKWKFCAFLLKENIQRVLTLKIDEKLKQQVVEAIQGILSLHEKAIETGKWAASAAWSAASAAWSAAWSAERSAASAAWSAASAAWSAESAVLSAASAERSAASAASSAERSAAYIKYANELLKLLKAEGK